jgi:hypothetical protein
MNREVKLRLLKALVNVPVWLLDRLVAFPKTVKFPQTQMLLRAYAKMAQAYWLHCVQGTFGNSDGNLERLLRLSVKILARISEDDRYYRAWVGLGFILAGEQMSKFNEEVAEIKRLIKVQWLMDLGFLRDQVIVHDRRVFLETVLCDYLANLARMELAECEFPRNA